MELQKKDYKKFFLFLMQEGYIDPHLDEQSFDEYLFDRFIENSIRENDESGVEENIIE
jgi:hypothetical protein